MWIGGTQLYSGGTWQGVADWTGSGDTHTKDFGSGTVTVTSAADKFTITLNSATITNSAASNGRLGQSAIYAEGSVLVIPNGQNTLTANGDNSACGIYLSSGSLTVDGYGILTVNAKEYGLFTADTLTLRNATVTVEGATPDYGTQSSALCAGQSASGVVINNATVTAMGRTYGIESQQSILIENGAVVTATSKGIYSAIGAGSDDTITITGSTVTAQNVRSNDGNYYAFNKAPTVDSGVEVKAGTNELSASLVPSPVDTTYTQNRYVKITPPSGSAKLSSITLTYDDPSISGGKMTETIPVNSETTEYSRDVDYIANSVTITLARENSNAQITVDSEPSDVIFTKDLAVGENIFTIIVTNGGNEETYTLTITRENPVTVDPAEDVIVPTWKIGTANPSPENVDVSSSSSTPLYIHAFLSGTNREYFSIGASLTHTQEMKGIKVDRTTSPTFSIYPYEKGITAAGYYTADLTLEFYTNEACTASAGIDPVTRNVKLTVEPADSVTSTYTVTYHHGNTLHATGSVDSVTADVGTPHTVKANGFTNLNKVFVNWNTKEDGSGTAYTPGETFSPSAGEMTLYAQWMDPQATAYTVKYNHGTTSSATGTMPDVSVIIGNTHTVKANGFGNSAEVFVNWNTEADGTGTPYAPGDTFTPTKDVTLYARWIAEGEMAYTVTYHHGTGNHITGTMNPIVVPVGTSHTVKANEFKNSEKVFDNWNTKADRTGISYNPGDSISEGMTLYAQWKDPEATYTVKYHHGNTQHATGTMSEDVLHPGETYVVKANGFGNPVDVFLNWNTKEDGSGTSYNPGDVLTAGDVTLYAQWRYAVTPQGHSGSGSSDGRYFEYPRTVKDGGSVSFGKSPVVVEVILPKGSTGDVVLTVESVEDWPAKEKTPYAFDISAPGKAEGIAQIIFKIKLADLERLEVMPKDVGIFHKVGDEWVQLKTVYEIKDTYVYYTADTDSFSPFEIRFVEDGAVPKDSAEPVVPDTPVTPETPDEPDTPVEPETPETPAPLLGVLAGLGAALIIRRK